jgi:AraC-like DNA-binding protein
MDSATSRNEAGSLRLMRATLSIGSFDLWHFAHFAHAFPRHAHEQFTIGVFERPHGSVSYRGSTWRAFTGGILAVAPDEVHAAEPGDDGWTYRALYPSRELVALALDDSAAARRAHFPSPVVDDARLSDALHGLIRRLAVGGDALAVEVELLACIRALVSRHSTERARPAPRTPTARAAELARQYLDEHYGTAVKLGPLAAMCGVNPFHLIRSFRDAVGLPPHAYLTQVRAQRARDLLLQGESLPGVAYRCGFCDQSHMTRTFKRIFGVTPGAYVDALR